MTPLEPPIEQIARTPRLLVACDFDGVLAPIVTDPDLAAALPACIDAARRLAGLAQTDVAFVSGRARADLARLVAGVPGAHLIGCHGAEPDDTQVASSESTSLLDRLDARLRALAATRPGFRIERKPVGIAFHYREADTDDAAAALGVIVSDLGQWPQVRARHGKMVVELFTVDASKGVALAALRTAVGATGVIFLGDDATDEEVFPTLGHGDLGVKVGEGGTGASVSVADPEAVGQLLTRLADRRLEWLESLRTVPIERHSMLSDQRTIALVDPAARVNWMCLPRIDSAAIFAELLGGSDAGFFAVSPAGAAVPGVQSYVGDTMVLRTTWPTLTVTDYFDCTAGRPYQRAGRTDLIRALEGTGQAVIHFAPRLDFGRVRTRLQVRENGLSVEGSPDPIILHAPGVSWRVIEQGFHQTAVAEVDLSGGPIVLDLRYGTASLREVVPPEPQRRAQSERFWSLWAASLSLPPVAADAVRRSALILKALCYGPTGAICAAGTTSLPEWPGGVRNWDYRSCWPRDACLAAAALVRLGNTGVAMKLLDWLVGVVEDCESPDRLRPIYTVAGRELGVEAEIGELAGYGGSRPVRVGNAAAQQVQLDVFGPIVDLVWMLAERGAPVSPEQWRLVEAMVSAVLHRWKEPDHGIWELRHERRHHVYSRIMCWLAVDRALRLADRLRAEYRHDWSLLRRDIANDIAAHGWSNTAMAFTAAYGIDDLDAAALHVGLSGLIPANDPRFVATVEAIERRLRRGATVYRYRCDDGLPGGEGGFHLCTGWLIESYVLLGRQREARALLDDLVSLAGPTGLLAEQYDSGRSLALGNVPQAYSHLAIVNAAVAISRSAQTDC